MITYQEEDYAVVLPEMRELYPAHWEEIAVNQDVIKLDMDYALYQHLNELGQLVVVTVRHDGLVVGYVMGLVKGHLHYRTTLHFLCDIFYLKPDHRKGFTGLKLFRKLEEVLKARGVVKMLLATKLHLDRSKMFKYLGYVEQEIVFQKILS